MTYSQHVHRLTAAAARLLTTPPDHRPPEHDARTALAARDLVVHELTAATTALTSPPRRGDTRDEPPDRPGLAAASLLTAPAQPLTAALTALPRTLPDPPPLRALLAAAEQSPSSWVRAWADAARAAAGLEAYTSRLPELPGPAAWAALRDLTEVTAALPHLDRDLAAALPAGLVEHAAALTEPVSHGLLRLSAGELLHQVRDVRRDPGEQYRPLDPPPAAPVPLRSPADLPDGMHRLTHTLSQISQNITLPDAHLIARLLAHGTHVTRTLAGSDPNPMVRAVADRLTPVGGLLEPLLTSRLGSTGTPDPRVRPLAGEAYRQLTSTLEHKDLAAALGWLTSAGPVSAALGHALHAAGQADRLLVRPSEHAPRWQNGLLWLPVDPTHAAQLPALQALHHNTQTLTTAGTAARRHLQRTPPPAARQQGSDVTRGAAERAATATSELRAALQARARAPITAPRPAHPAQPLPPPGLPGPRRT